MTALRAHPDDPSEAVETAFLRIQHERMAGVAVVNPALRVEAVGFQPWQGHWLGAVVTPWCMSVLLVPRGEAGWTSVGVNQRRFVKFPYGELAFLHSDEPELGEFQTCSLFSPMDRFAAQAQAQDTARASLAALLSAPADTARAPAVAAQRQPSRRGFLGLAKSTRA